MASRLELQAKLEEILGSRNVYFQPPKSMEMKYPAIRYSLNRISNVGADDTTYLRRKSYSVMIMDKNPDTEIPEKLENSMEYFGFDRHYTIDNLNHYVYTVYY